MEIEVPVGRVFFVLKLEEVVKVQLANEGLHLRHLEVFANEICKLLRVQYLKVGPALGPADAGIVAFILLSLPLADYTACG